jgi:hypothetical protein
MAGDGRELGGGAIRRNEGKVLSHLSFHRAEDIGGAATLVFTILTRLPAWLMSAEPNGRGCFGLAARTAGCSL